MKPSTRNPRSPSPVQVQSAVPIPEVLRMMQRAFALAVLAVLFVLSPALGQPPASPPADKPAKPDAPPKPAPEEKSSVTRHTLTLDGKALPYTATAGTLQLKDEDGTVKALIFYIAYTLDGVKD